MAPLTADLCDELASAFDRVDDFRKVQAGSDPEAMLEAVNCLQEAVGIGEEARAMFAERVGTYGNGREIGAVLLGVIIGLFAADEILQPRTGRSGLG